MKETQAGAAQGRGPQAQQRSHTHRVRDHVREDPYHWLRVENWQEVMRDPSQLDTEVRQHLERENAHTEEQLAPTVELQAQLFEELRGRIKETDSSVPEKDGPWDYYSRYEKGAQHPRYCRRPSARRAPVTPGAEQESVLHDADAAAQGHAYYDPGGLTHSPDHSLLAHSMDTLGSEYFEIHFSEIPSGKPLPDKIENTTGNVVFSADSTMVFYTRVDENHRPCRVYRHVLGSDSDNDVLVYEESDPGFFVGVDQTEDRSLLLITAHDHTTSEVRVLPAHSPALSPTLVAPRSRGVEYRVSSLDEQRLLILTNCDEAQDFKLVEAPRSAPSRENWKDLIPHQPGCFLVAAVTFKHHMVWLERFDALPRLRIRRLDSGEEHSIAFDETCFSIGLSGSLEYDTPWLRFTYSSLTTPQRVFDYHMDTRERVLLKEREIPSGHNPERYRSERLIAKSFDGAEVPVSLLWHEQTPRDGSAPVLLYGYGSYGITIPAAFSSNCLSLVRRGFVYAIAHPRGGKDRGHAWYEEGKLQSKTNTFRDFVAAAEALCKAGWASAGNISIHGGSAGGLLVAAAANLRPDLFCSVLAEVPFVDVLTTMCDPSLPLTPPEWTEWGNPIESESAYECIESYSPYDNVRAQEYPHILATAGLTDPRVTYWEPAKWVARLREYSTSEARLLLKTYMEAGHAGAAGRFDKLREVAVVYAFALQCHGRLETPLLPAS